MSPPVTIAEQLAHAEGELQRLPATLAYLQASRHISGETAAQRLRVQEATIATLRWVQRVQRVTADLGSLEIASLPLDGAPDHLSRAHG